jgi:hypothetical protein
VHERVLRLDQDDIGGLVQRLGDGGSAVTATDDRDNCVHCSPSEDIPIGSHHEQ